MTTRPSRKTPRKADPGKKSTAKAGGGAPASPVVLGALVVVALVIAAVVGVAVLRNGAPASGTGASAGAQQVSIAVGGGRYEPSVVHVAADKPITITVGQGEGCATRFLMPALGIDKDVSAGPVTFDIGPLKPGTYAFQCPMNMYRGQIIVE